MTATPHLTLAELQSTFQRAVMDGDDAILPAIGAGAREPREVMLGVYRHAYISRLVEFVTNDYEALHTYLGDETFYEMAEAYARASPSTTRNARYFAIHLPDYLAATAPYRDHAEIADLARIEKALGDAFDAPDAPVLTLAELSAFAIDDWPRLVLVPQPSARRLDLATNAFDIWRALKDEADPPAPVTSVEPSRLLVWREEVPKIRPLSPEEAMMWDEAAKGVRFGVLCEMVATFDDADTAAARAAGYLAGWIAGGLLTAARLE
jgi:Putative DNA-binding domain